MNVSQLLAETNIFRAKLRKNLLGDEPKLYSSFHFKEFFADLENSAQKISRAFASKDSQGRTMAEKLAQVLNTDRARQEVSRNHLFYSMYDYGVNPRHEGLSLDDSAAQEVLGSLFETLDTLIQAQDDTGSHIGENDRQENLNLDRLSNLTEVFDGIVEKIFVNLSNSTIDTIAYIIDNVQERFYSDTSMKATIESASIKQTQPQTH